MSIKAVFVFSRDGLKGGWTGPKPDGELHAPSGPAKTPKRAVYWLRPVDGPSEVRPVDGPSEVLLVATPDKAKGAETLEDWLKWLKLLGAIRPLPGMSDDCLIWFHATDFPQWRGRFRGIGAELGVLAGEEFELGAAARVLMSSRVRLPGHTPLDVGDLVNAIARPGAAEEVCKGLVALRALANAINDAPKGPAPEDMLPMRLSFWRHELFRTVGALKWDLKLDSESSRGRARAGAEPAADRIKAVLTEIEADAKALQGKYAGGGNGEAGPWSALMALTNALKVLESATRRVASGDPKDHTDFVESLAHARVKFAEAASAAESVREQATPQQGRQP